MDATWMPHWSLLLATVVQVPQCLRIWLGTLFPEQSGTRFTAIDLLVSHQVCPLSSHWRSLPTFPPICTASQSSQRLVPTPQQTSTSLPSSSTTPCSPVRLPVSIVFVTGHPPGTRPPPSQPTACAGVPLSVSRATALITTGRVISLPIFASLNGPCPSRPSSPSRPTACAAASFARLEPRIRFLAETPRASFSGCSNTRYALSSPCA